MKTPKMFIIFILITSYFFSSCANALLLSHGILIKTRKGGTITFSDDIYTSRIAFGEFFVYFYNINLKSGFLEIIGINCDNESKINIISISKDKIIFYFSLEKPSEAIFYIEKPPTKINSLEWTYYPNNTLKIISETPRKITIDFTETKLTPSPPPYYPPSPPPKLPKKPKEFFRAVSISLKLVSSKIKQRSNKPYKAIQKILDILIAILAELIIKIQEILNTPIPKYP